MPELTWDEVGERQYETGVDHGVLYLLDEDGEYSTGVPWNGLTTVTEQPSGAEATPTYADNMKYLNLISVEVFGATIEAYTYPPEFRLVDGLLIPSPGVTVGQQPRKQFGLSYRTKIGNDVVGNALGFKLHLVYACIAAPSEKAYETVNDTPSPIDFSWTLSTTPVPVTGMDPTSCLVIDSTEVDEDKLATLMADLYGDPDDGTAHLPLPDDVLAIFA